MTTNSISTRQLCFILAIFSPVTKIILMPSTLASYVGNDLLLAALLLFILQGGATFALLWLIRERQATLFSLMENRFGKVTARVCYVILSAYLIFASALPLLEHRVYVQNLMFDTRPTILIFACFFLFSAYAAAKGLQSAGRAADVSAPLFTVAFTVLLLMSAASADFTELLPVGRTPFLQLSRGAAAVLCWFSDAAYLLVLAGHVRVEKKFLTKTMFSYALGAVAVLLFLSIFYGVFSLISVRELYAVAVIARYYNALKTIGRIDYIFIYILSLIRLFALVLPIQLATHALAQAFSSQKYPLFSLIVNLILLVFSFLTAEHFLSVSLVFSRYLFPVFLVFADMVPLLCPLLAVKTKKEKGL